jgi:hypothetical protein
VLQSLSQETGCGTTHPMSALLERLLTYTFVSRFTPKSCMMYMSGCGERSHAWSPQILTPIFGHRVGLTHPNDVFPPPSLDAIKDWVWQVSRDNLDHQLLQESLIEYHSKFSFVLKSLYSSTSKLINSALHHYHPGALHQLTCKHPSTSSTINLLIFTQEL